MRDDQFMETMNVGQVAALAGISVRTLHHWDAIGLASPSLRSWNGYREYTREDVMRIKRICLYRETGMALEDISRILASAKDEAAHLHSQRELLLERISHLQKMVHAVDQMIEKNAAREEITVEELSNILGSEWNPSWQDEAEERWGGTNEWAQSDARKSTMTKRDWEALKESAELFEADCAHAFQAGVSPTSEEAAALAERHLESMNFWFTTTYERQVLIARGYVADPRFRKHYNQRAEGLAEWLKASIDANARAHGVDPDTASWE